MIATNGGVGFRQQIRTITAESLVPLDEEAAELEARLKIVNEERRAIRAVIRAVDPPEPKPGALKRGRKPKIDVMASGGSKYTSVRDFLVAHADDGHTVSGVARELSLTNDKVSRALIRLRQEGLIRLAGKAPGPGAPKLYRVIKGVADGV